MVSIGDRRLDLSIYFQVGVPDIEFYESGTQLQRLVTGLRRNLVIDRKEIKKRDKEKEKGGERESEGAASLFSCVL